MLRVPDVEAAAVRTWLESAGMRFRIGTDEATELTDRQLHEQLKMYVAVLRIADDFGLDAVGIQYQQGLKDLTPASDLPEGLLNNVERPPVTSRDGSRVLYEGAPLPHFNEADEGVAVDALITNRVWTAMGGTRVRWGERYGPDFVWVYEISGSVPPSHLTGGYRGAVSWRQGPIYFPAGGGTIKGVSRPGEIVGRGSTRRRPAAAGHRAGVGGRAAGRGDRAALGRDQPGVADRARGHARRHPGPVHGPAQGQPRADRVRPRRGDGRPGARGQGGAVRPPRRRRPPVRGRAALTAAVFSR